MHLAHLGQLLNDPDPSPGFFDHAQGVVNFGRLVGSGNGGAQAGLALRHCRGDHRHDEQVFVLAGPGESKGTLVGAAQYRDDGGGGKHGVKSGLFQTIDEMPAIVTNLLDAPGFI